MPSSPGAPPQRVCPHCSTVAYSVDPHCPYCGRSYRRRILPGIAALLVVVAALAIAGVALLLLAARDEFDRRVDRQVERVQDDFDREVDRLQRELLRELDRRLPATPTP